ncbi:hypothetical protein L227DRAFT_574304 [Lentinus tigrinus ALCF2SS1-6]|uniref:Protein kinase domain-containing protein n=2 Tax=Lentinus tigrinus TaxID=5365 RepID=A0A5C2SDH6_9APHY|nr:hypothetical protein L227DRAFT_574304 [Lentinus tigrinus ALCF2SS1-6]
MFTFRQEHGRVVAKFPHPTCGAHQRIHKEGMVYGAFPFHLSEYARLKVDDDDGQPAPVIPERSAPKKGGKLKQVCRAIGRAIKDAATSSTLEAPPPRDACDRMRPRMVTVPPIVPKFFGYYIPVEVPSLSCHPTCGPWGTCPIRWPQPILLMEDCGSPIDLGETPERYRRECATLVDWLHDGEFLHSDLRPSKFLVQAGPLTVPPHRRSWQSPSFRLVGFGMSNGLPISQDDDFWFEFEDSLCEEDYERACRVLGLPPPPQH